MKFTFNLEKDEYVFGLTANDGLYAPFKEGFKRDLNVWHGGNQAASLLLTTKGRFIYSKLPLNVEFKSSSFDVESEENIEFKKVGGSLKEAYQYVAKNIFRHTNKIVDLGIFIKPQYNTWIEMPYECTQEKVLKYAHEILDNGFPSGVLMIDDCWSKDYGVWEFDKEKFPNPKKLVDELHSLGFKVMLWNCPFVSLDSKEFRKLEPLGYFVKNQDDSTFITRWWNGYSAVFDLSNKDAFNYYKNVLVSLMEQYGIDGFKIDAGDPEYYRKDNKFANSNCLSEQAYYLSLLGEEFSLSELRVGFNNGISPVANRLRDKNHSWDNEGINTLINDGIALGLLGYPFLCPDMIGGGMLLSFETEDFKFDEELFVKYSFASCLFPMMQFSLSPWKVLSKENLELVNKSVEIHTHFEEEIINIALNSKDSGEPIIRHLIYEFNDPKYAYVNDEFLLGDSLLVIPNIYKGNKRKVIIPAGEWKDELSGKTFNEGEYFVTMNLKDILILRKVK